MTNIEEINQLISQLNNGNMDAFDEFYEKTKSAVYYTIISIIKDKSLSEDVMQDTYLKILKSLNKYKMGTNPLAWMIMIARNHAINVYNRRKKEILVDEKEDPTIFGVTPFHDDFEGPIMKKMHECLNPKEIELITMHVINELTHKEIAQILNRPLGTVLWQYNKAINKLKKKVGENNG